MDSNTLCKDVLAVGIVILISIAIAAGIVFLLVLLGILWALFSRRRHDDDKLAGVVDDDDDSSAHARPTSLLAHINAATRNTIMGGQHSPYGEYSAEKQAAGAGALAGSTAHGHDHETDGEDGVAAGAYRRAYTPSEGAQDASGDEFRVAHARYSFDGGEEGELPLSAGGEVHVLDDRDPAYVLLLFLHLYPRLTSLTAGGTRKTRAQDGRAWCPQITWCRYLTWPLVLFRPFYDDIFSSSFWFSFCALPIPVLWISRLLV